MKFIYLRWLHKMHDFTKKWFYQVCHVHEMRCNFSWLVLYWSKFGFMKGCYLKMTEALDVCYLSIMTSSMGAMIWSMGAIYLRLILQSMLSTEDDFHQWMLYSLPKMDAFYRRWLYHLISIEDVFINCRYAIIFMKEIYKTVENNTY